MAKDNERTTSKRRSKTTSEAESEVDVYKKVVEFEEKEAHARNGIDDMNLYLETCQEIRQMLTDIYELKTAPTEAKDTILKKRVQACIRVSVLKKLNRLEKVRMLHARETLQGEKQKLESINLQFQNLVYEVEHLESEFRKCKQYKSKDEDITLIPVDEFLSIGPEDVVTKFAGKSTLTTNEQHELHLAMLEHELGQRVKLAKLLEELQLEKKSLEKDIVNRKTLLDGIDPKLAVVVAATKPLQEHLGLNTNEIRSEHKLACHLSDQLYLLYCNAQAYAQYMDSTMTIKILGDVEEVLQFNEAQRVDIEDSDHEADNQEEPAEPKKHRHRKGIVIDRQEEKKKKLLLAHPLSLEITITVKELEGHLKMRFSFLYQLRIVTVTSSFVRQDENTHNGNCAREILTGESILNHLFEGDTGIESPNPRNFFQLKAVGLKSFESLVPQLGYAYEWAQKICAVECINSQNYEQRLKKLRIQNVEETFKTICQRLKARAGLAEQLQHLESGNIPAIPDWIDYPKSSISTLSKFNSITYQRFCTEYKNAKQLVDSEIIADINFFYLATLTRAKATLYAYIVIKNDYPSQAPWFFINVKHNGEHNNKTSDEVRDMERNINIDWRKITDDSGIASWLLALQIRSLCSFFDIYLETDKQSNFPNSTVFFHGVRSRSRRRPYKFRKIGSGVFTQY